MKAPNLWNLLFFELTIVWCALDNSNLWRDLTVREKKDWYNTNDLCLISSSRNDPFEKIAETCDSSSKAAGELMKLTRCRAGNSWPSRSGFCAPYDYPFTERPSLHKIVKGYDDSQKKPLLSFFRKLSKEGGALLIIGDSVMQQFYSALACELEREKVWKDSSKFTNTDEIQYVRTTDHSGSSPHKVEIRFINVYHFVNGRYDRTPDAALTKIKNTVDSLSSTYNSLTVLVNVGLHYVDKPVQHFTRIDYTKQLTVALSYLHNYSLKHNTKTIRIFWRETTAQHFPTSNGYWPGEKYSNTMKLHCVPINDTSYTADWRNRDIETIIQTNKLFRIKIIPFYNITKPLYAGHPGGHMKDCTHLCWSPMLYMPIFNSMDRMMDESIKNS